PPGAMVSGNDMTAATWNSAEEDEILFMDRGAHPPLLLIIKLRSLKAPTQTLPKLPLSAITVAICCSIVPFPVACTVTDGFAGSLLAIVSVVVLVPVEVGVKVTWNGKQKFGLICTGNFPEGFVTANWGLDEVMEFTCRLLTPVLQTSSVAVLVLSTQVLPMATLPGTWICGPVTRKAWKKLLTGPIGPVWEADANTANRRPTAQAL